MQLHQGGCGLRFPPPLLKGTRTVTSWRRRVCNWLCLPGLSGSCMNWSGLKQLFRLSCRSKKGHTEHTLCGFNAKGVQKVYFEDSIHGLNSSCKTQSHPTTGGKHHVRQRHVGWTQTHTFPFTLMFNVVSRTRVSAQGLRSARSCLPKCLATEREFVPISSFFIGHPGAKVHHGSARIWWQGVF